MSELALDAEMQLFPTARGGRQGPVRNGYRPALWFGETAPTGEPELHSVLVRPRGKEALQPGELANVELLPIAFETWPPLKEGARFDVIDAGRTVGAGTLRASPSQAATAAELRKALSHAIEEWVTERFGDRVDRRTSAKR